MKRLFFVFLCVIMCIPMVYAELPIYTRVSASCENDDDLVNIYLEPDLQSLVVGQLVGSVHGLDPSLLLQYDDRWSKIEMGGVIGYVESAKVDFQTWYNHTGSYVLVSIKDNTPIYVEDYSGEDSPQKLDVIPKWTIITDTMISSGDYYILETAHDYLFVKKSDVRIYSREELLQ